MDDQTPVRIHGETPLTSVPNYAGHVTNIPPIEAAASGRGYLNTEPDKDGVVRLVPLLVAVHGELAPTFGLELLRVAVGEPLYSVHADRHGVRGVQLGDTFIPTDPDGRRRLYFSKADGSGASLPWTSCTAKPLPMPYRTRSPLLASRPSA